jgi:hypothetical protein
MGASKNSISGTYAFPVQEALISTEPQDECDYPAMSPDGTYVDFGILLTDTAFPNVCVDGGPSSDAAGHRFVDIQMKSISYAPGGNLGLDGGETPITPGTYPVSFEGEDDDDLCMAGAAMPLLDVRDFGSVDGGGAMPVASALSGTVTLTTVGSGHIAGSFDVMMVAYLPSGLFDTAHPTPFSGTFDARSCGALP